MRGTRIIAVAAVLVAILCASALAAEKEAEPVTVVYKSGDTVGLKSLEIGVEEGGLFGSTYRKLKKLPVKTDKLQLKVPLENLAKIEFLSADKEGKNIQVRLTAHDGKTLEAAVDSKSKIIWKGTHTFADAEVTLDPAQVKEIVLKPPKKEKKK